MGNKYMFFEILEEMGCYPAIFWENVGDDATNVKQKILSASTREEIVNIVNNYI